MSKYVMALDQGTTSSRAIIFDEHQNIVNMAQKEFTQHYPKAGWVEHDPLEIYASQYGVLVEVLARSGMEAGEISAIGITNQRETTIVWDKNTADCSAMLTQERLRTSRISLSFRMFINFSLSRNICLLW